MTRPSFTFHPKMRSVQQPNTLNPCCLSLRRRLFHSSSAASSITSTSSRLLNQKSNDGESESSASNGKHKFRPGDKIQVEVTSFGPLGASVDVVGLSHDPDSVLLDTSAPAYATGLILQKEIQYFRRQRQNLDVVRGELLPAYVEYVRPQDGKLNIALRPLGYNAQVIESPWMNQVLQTLKDNRGVLPVGDKSTPEAIQEYFPGLSKSVFKKVIAHLYKNQQVKPYPDKIVLTNRDNKNERLHADS